MKTSWFEGLDLFFCVCYIATSLRTAWPETVSFLIN